MAAVRHFEFAIFWYFVTWPSLEPKSAVAHQISLKLDDPRLRYSEKNIRYISAADRPISMKFSDIDVLYRSPGVLESANVMFSCDCSLDLQAYLTRWVVSGSALQSKSRPEYCPEFP